MPHAFKKEIREGGITALYRGSVPFLATYCMFVSTQFTIYEYMMAHFKSGYVGQEEEYKKKETQYNIMSGFLAGAIGAGITNSFDVVTINK